MNALHPINNRVEAAEGDAEEHQDRQLLVGREDLVGQEQDPGHDDRVEWPPPADDRGRGQEPVTVQGRTLSAVTVNMC